MMLQPLLTNFHYQLHILYPDILFQLQYIILHVFVCVHVCKSELAEVAPQSPHFTHEQCALAVHERPPSLCSLPVHEHLTHLLSAPAVHEFLTQAVTVCTGCAGAPQ